MITPALLISACGTLVLSTSNRLSRVVDRVRVLTAESSILLIREARAAVVSTLQEMEYARELVAAVPKRAEG